MKKSTQQNWGRRLLNVIESLDRDGTFATNGSAGSVLPGLEVNGVGSIGLPLSAAQASQLKKHCEQAAYGKGEQTVVDTKVRRVWRLTPDRFQLINPAWTETLEIIVAKVQQALGLDDQKLTANLYDLLLYEKGGFFLPHRDGEKLNKMVATLVIVLPSDFTGGELIVRHEGQEEVIDFSSPEGKFATQYAAFYADCEHEVKQLTGGHRLCLVYNLTVSGKSKVVGAPRHLDAVNQAVDALKEWTSEGEPQKIAVTLEHQYTQQGMSWDTLKGADASRARMLAEAAESTGYHAYLSLLTFWQSGGCEDGYDEYYSSRRRRRRYDDDEEEEDTAQHKMSEIYDSSLTAEHWQSPDGTAATIGKIPIETDEILPEGSLTAIKPEEDFQGYTGNEGMTLERWYRRAAIVLWHESRHFEVLCKAGARQAVPMLLQLISKAKKAREDELERLTDQCRQFTEQILAAWPEQKSEQYHGRSTEEDAALGDPIRAIAFLDDPKLIRRYLRDTLVKDAALQPAKSLAKILVAHHWTPFKDDLAALFQKTDAYTLTRNFQLLNALCNSAANGGKAAWRTQAIDLCRGLAQMSVQSLIRIDTSPADPSAWRVKRDEKVILASLVKALLTTGAEEALPVLANHIMASFARYSLQQTVAPVLVDVFGFMKGNKQPESAALSAWILQCEHQFDVLTAESPQPPDDFQREAKLTCKCADCTELNRFLSDPSTSYYRFAMPQRRRDHLADQIRHSNCDLDFETDRRPRPQVLVCKKNTASYARLLKEYHDDLNHLAALRACH